MMNHGVYYEVQWNAFELMRSPKKLLFILIGILFGFSALAQTPSYNLPLGKTSIEAVINELRKQSDINFIFNNEELAKCDSVTISMKDASLEEVLKEVLKGTDLSYKKIDNTIVIAPKETSESSTKSPSKSLAQTVRGTIKDGDTQMPLIGATVKLLGSDPIVGTVSDVDGKFRLEKIPIGRIALELSYLGYETRIIPNIVVNSGKEVVLNLELQESTVKMLEVVISATPNAGEAINDMSINSARSISPEESSRYAGPFNDPSRIMSNYSGVAATQDGSNDIIVRGNSPKYLQWRLEGVQITNPNHFADQNAVGAGGISALNNNLLSTSDFYSGAFAPEYGDALSGVYDIKLRTGNNEKFESVFGFGILGTDLTFEGPFKKGYGGSYLVNYRYSTVSLIRELGLVDVDGVPKFQDAAIKIVLPTKKAGVFSFFGLSGLSGFDLENVDIADGWNAGDTPRSSKVQEQDYDTRSFLINTGLNHTLMLNNNSFVKTTLSYSNDGIQDNVFESNRIPIYDNNGGFLRDSISAKSLNYKARLSQSAYRGAVTYTNKINPRNKLQVGTRYTLFDFDNRQSMLSNDLEERVSLLDFKEKIGTIRNFVSWKYRITEDLTTVVGLHNMNVLYNQKSTLEPRLAVNWQLNNGHAVHAGYGSHSTMESVHNYFAKVEQEDGSIIEPNKDLDLLKAHHFVVGYEKRFSKNRVAKLEVYYQDLYNLPVENNDTSFYATINEGLDYRYVDLVNKGTGKNYGVELSLERYFNNNFYYLLNASLFESTYKSLEGVERNTKYNGNYVVNVLCGKEYTELGKKNNQTLGLNAKAFFGGAKKIIPLLRDDQGNLAVDPATGQFWDYEKAYEEKLDDIYSITLSVSYKWNKPKATHELWMNLDNLTGNQGKISEYYDPTEPGSTGYVTQFGFFPNLMYRVYF